MAAPTESYPRRTWDTGETHYQLEVGMARSMGEPFAMRHGSAPREIGRAASLTVIGGATLVTLGCADARGGVPLACRDEPIAWSEARTIWSEQAGSVQVNPSSAAVTGRVLYATGLHLGGPPNNDLFAVRASLDGGAPLVLQRPPGGTRYEEPIIAATPDGRATVVWGERYEEAGGPEIDSSVRSLWASTFDGMRWSPAERIAAGYMFRWNGVSQSDFVASPDGALHLAVSGMPRGARTVVVYLTRHGGKWVVHEAPILSGDVAYVALAVHGEHVMIGYVAPVLGTNDLNSMFFMSSSDRGRTWAPGSLVSRSGQRAARDPRLVVSSPRDIHLVWGQNQTGGLSTDAIRHVSSSDGGETWTSPVDIGAPHQPFQVRGAALAPGGNVYVLFSQRGMDALAVARWCGGRWHGAQSAPTSEFFSGKAALIVDAQGAVGAVWSDLQLTSPRTADLRWRFATAR